MSPNPKRPLTPVKAIFHDVLPAQQRDVPSWLRKPGAITYGSSLPPQSAAALLHASAAKPNVANENEPPLPSEQSTTQPKGQTSDPLLDARVQSQSIAAEASESWLPAASPQSLDRNARIERELDELRHAILSLKNAESALLEHMTPQLLRLTRLIAERVIETEALKDPELPLRLVREAMGSLNHGGQVAVVLGTAFGPTADLLQTTLEQDGIRCEVQVLEHLTPFACQVKANLGAVDESLETRLDHVLQSFLGGDEVN